MLNSLIQQVSSLQAQLGAENSQIRTLIAVLQTHPKSHSTGKPTLHHTPTLHHSYRQISKSLRTKPSKSDISQEPDWIRTSKNCSLHESRRQGKSGGIKKQRLKL